MGPRVPFMSDPFGAIRPNKVVETEKEHTLLTFIHQNPYIITEKTVDVPAVGQTVFQSLRSFCQCQSQISVYRILVQID